VQRIFWRVNELRPGSAYSFDDDAALSSECDRVGDLGVRKPGFRGCKQSAWVWLFSATRRNQVSTSPNPTLSSADVGSSMHQVCIQRPLRGRYHEDVAVATGQGGRDSVSFLRIGRFRA